MTLRSLTAALLLPACGQPASVDGRVVDIWGGPVPGATVLVQGTDERLLADGDGRFALAAAEAARQVKVGAKGYVHEYADVPAGPPASPLFVRLYPKPAELGLHLVGNDAYLALPPLPVERVGTELRSWRGLRREPAVLAEGGDVEVVFHTDLALGEVMRMGLELHRLDFVHRAELPSPLGRAEVDVDLWVSEAAVPVDIEPLRSRRDFRLVARDLPPGTYAFATDGLLDEAPGVDFAAVPPEVRVAFPFVLR